MTPDEILIAVFAYNRPLELDICLRSLRENACGFPVIVYDDRSTDPAVAATVGRYGYSRVEGLGTSTGKHGGLYENMNAALDAALAKGIKYLLVLQDDMQVVRSMDSAVLKEYATIFAADEAITQIDPRFVREDGSQVRRCSDMPAFEWIDPYRRTYSDVGLFSVARLTALGWRFSETEAGMREKAEALGMRRVYPFTPVAMHVPFPTKFRQRESTRAHRTTRPGRYSYRQMTEADKWRMDNRPANEPPLFRKFLKVRGLGLLLDRFRWHRMKDDSILS